MLATVVIGSCSPVSGSEAVIGSCSTVSGSVPAIGCVDALAFDGASASDGTKPQAEKEQ